MVVIARHEAISFDKIVPQMRFLLPMKNRDRNNGKLKKSMVACRRAPRLCFDRLNMTIYLSLHIINP